MEVFNNVSTKKLGNIYLSFWPVLRPSNYKSLRDTTDASFRKDSFIVS